MSNQSLDSMGWPPGGDPTAPELPGIGDLVELGEAAGLPEGHKTFRARVTAVSSAGPELAYLAVDRDDVTPQHREYHLVRTAGIVIITKAAAT